MRNRILILLAALSLILAAPLLAQSEEPQPMEETQVEHSAELTADTEDGATATATATSEGSVTTEEQPEMQGESAINESDVEAEASANISAEEERELPQTAGFLPLLALLGLGSIATALGLRAVRRK